MPERISSFRGEWTKILQSLSDVHFARTVIKAIFVAISTLLYI